jgi:hypothetical protein
VGLGNISLPLPPTLRNITVQLGPLTNVTLAALRVNITGLDELALLDVLSPTSNTSLASLLRAGAVSVSLQLGTRPALHPAPLNETLWVALLASGLAASTSGTLGLDPAAIASTELLQYLRARMPRSCHRGHSGECVEWRGHK